MSEYKYISIVDDHALFRKGLSLLVSSFVGYKVLFDADNGKDFIDQMHYSKQEPDIVLLDVSMPEMDGFETARWIHTNYPKIKVLALSTLNTEEPIIKMIKNGARGYVLKDIAPKDLKLALDELIQIGYYYNDQISRKIMNTIIEAESTNSSIIKKLSAREEEFLKLTCSELSYKEIANEMCISPRTIDGYRDALFEKLQIKTRTGLVVYAIKNGYVKI